LTLVLVMIISLPFFNCPTENFTSSLVMSDRGTQFWLLTEILKF
jgi:hypothetical protein